MSVSSALARRIVKPKAKDTKRLKDESFIDVEAREVKDLPRLGDSTMRADKRDIKTSRGGRGKAVAAGVGGTAAAIAAFSGGKEDKGTKETKDTSAKSTKAAPTKSVTPVRGFEAAKKQEATAEKPRATTRSASGKEFDSKFAEMRRAGKDTFTWKGKSYSTRQSGESAQDHKAKMQKIRDKTEKEMQRITTMYKGGMPKKAKKK
jgi:hypothetical protein